MDEKEFMKWACEQAEKCKSEGGAVRPKVAAVAVKDGQMIGSAHRGELGSGEHAEFTLLEKKLKDDNRVPGATVYATLEPCTTRGDPKIPCAQRLVDRKVKRV